MSCQPSLHDVEESGYATAVQHSASCDSSNNEAEADLQSQSHLHHQIGVGTPQECQTPPRPNRQARHTPLQSFCRRRITDQLFKACHPPGASSQPMLCSSVRLCMTNPLPDPAEYMSAFNYQHWPVASTSAFSPPAKPLARFCSKDVASDGQQCQASSEASRHNSVSCSPIQLRNNALHCRRCNGMFDSSARLQCNEVELLPVTSNLRDPRRRTHPGTAPSLKLVPHLLRSVYSCCWLVFCFLTNELSPAHIYTPSYADPACSQLVRRSNIHSGCKALFVKLLAFTETYVLWPRFFRRSLAALSVDIKSRITSCTLQPDRLRAAKNRDSGTCSCTIDAHLGM